MLWSQRSPSTSSRSSWPKVLRAGSWGYQLCLLWSPAESEVTLTWFFGLQDAPSLARNSFDINSLSTFISDCPTFLVKGSKIMLGGCQEKGSTWASGRGDGARTPLGDRRRAFYGFTMSPRGWRDSLDHPRPAPPDHQPSSLGGPMLQGTQQSIPYTLAKHPFQAAPAHSPGCLRDIF